VFDSSHYSDYAVARSITGPSASHFLNYLTPADVREMQPYTSTLSVLLDEGGSIIDDCIITKHSEDESYLVTNALRRDRDLKHIENAMNTFHGE
jgi:glycine cleavage system aminomethyltransferase T